MPSDHHSIRPGLDTYGVVRSRASRVFGSSPEDPHDDPPSQRRSSHGPRIATTLPSGTTTQAHPTALGTPTAFPSTKGTT